LVACEKQELIGIERAAQDASVAADAAAEAHDPADANVDATARDGGDGGDGGLVLNDGAAGDSAARVDAGTSSHPGELVLTVLRGRVPLPATRVIFHDESGRVLADRKTGPDGRVSCAGARALTVVVSLIYEDGGELELFSYLGLAPDADLTLQLQAAGPLIQVGTYEVHWQGSSPYLSLDIGGCGSESWFSGKPAQVERVAMIERCRDRARSALAFAEVTNDMGRHVLGFLSASSLPPLQGDLTPLQLTAAHEAQLVELARNPVGANLVRLIGYRGDETFELPAETKTSANKPVAAAFPAGLLDTLSLVARSALDRTDGKPFSYQEVARKVAPEAAVRDVGFGSALPLLSDASLERDAAQRFKISWQSAGSLTRADHAIARLEWPATGANWMVVFPASGSSLTLPEIPSDVPPPAGSLALNELRFGDFPSLADYSAFAATRQLMALELSQGGVVEPEIAGPQVWERTIWQATSAFEPKLPCNTLPTPVGGDVRLKYGKGDAPGVEGGVIADGLYRLEQMLLYGATSETPLIQGRVDTLEIKGSTWQHVAYHDNTPTTRYTEKVTLDGISFSPQVTCTDNVYGSQLLGLVSRDSGQYGSDGDVLMLVLPTWTPMDGHVTFTYRRVVP
jgi:hypothetical protein